MRRSVLVLLFLSATSLQAAITGVLIRDDGSPLAGATVRAFVRQPSDAAIVRLLSDKPDAEPIATAKSAGDGRFSIDVKGTVAVGLVVDVAGAPAVAFFAADREDTGAVVVPSNVRRVTVTAGGKPVPNAIIGVGDFAVLHTDASGNFPLIARGPLTVIAPDLAPGTSLDMKSPNELVLTRGFAIHGKVVGADGQPVAGATVFARNVPLAQTASDGTFAIAHAPDRTTLIEATTANAAGSARSRGSDIVIHLHPAASLRGTVSGPSGPVAGAVVSITERGEPLSQHIAIADSHGAFTIAPLVVGSRLISATHPVYSSGVPRETAVTGATTVSLRVGARGSIEGRVVDEEQKPVAGAVVISDEYSHRAALTNAAGEYALPIEIRANLLPKIVVFKSGYAPAVHAGIRMTAPAKKGVNVKLMRGFPLQLRVIDRDHAPVADARVAIDTTTDIMRAAPLPCSLAEFEPCRTGPDGTIAMRIAEGRYEVKVSGDSVASRTVSDQPLTAANNPVTITVDRGAELSGHVAFDDGSPVAGARVYSRRMPVTTTTDAKGAFTLKGLPRTAIQLSVETADTPPMESSPVIATPPANNVSIVLPQPARIEGRVLDRATSQPVTSFTVAVLPRGTGFVAPHAVTMASDDGSFVLERVSPGDIVVQVSAPGYVGGRVSDLTATAGKTTSGVEVKLDRGMKVAGRVTSAGEPVAGVAVSLTAPPMMRIGSGPVQTDENGEFTMDGIAAGEQSFSFMKDGFVRKQKSVTVAAGKDARLDVELDRGLELHGRVIDRSGQPVAGVQIQITAAGARSASTANSDDDGTFSVAGLPPGTHFDIRTRKSGYVSAALNDVDPASAAPVSITLDRGATITGRVTGLSASDLGTVHVIAYGGGSQADAFADPSGAFTLSGLPDGRITVMGTIEGAHQRNATPKWIDVVNGSAPPVVLEFGQGITIHGHVTRNGAPLANGRVMFVASNHVLHGAAAMIASDGTYEVTGVENGDYDVRIYSADMSSDVRKYTVSGDGTFDIDLQGGTVRGHVVDANTGEPLQNAQVTLVATPQQPISRHVLTDSDGSFSLEAIPDGTFKIVVQRESYSSASDQVSVNGGTATPMDFKLTSGDEQVIRLVDADTGALLDGPVVVSRDNKPVPVTPRKTDDGAQKVWLDRGAYSVRAFARGYLPQSANFSVPGPEVRLALKQAGSVMLSSRSGGEFRIAAIGQPNPRMAKVAPNSSAFLDAMPPGLWTIEKLDVDGVTVIAKYDVTVVAGQTQKVNAD